MIVQLYNHLNRLGSFVQGPGIRHGLSRRDGRKHAIADLKMTAELASRVSGIVGYCTELTRTRQCSDVGLETSHALLGECRPDPDRQLNDGEEETLTSKPAGDPQHGTGWRGKSSL